MNTISLRLPESLHGTARDVAEQEDISLNQLPQLVHGLLQLLPRAGRLSLDHGRTVTVRERKQKQEREHLDSTNQ